ncbi:MAG: hypothetical protein OEV40_04600, partial [Acidimicrobiia bacterium]|nr:hypothetical protein [Acidimicrobiia bacterium]
MTSSQGDKAGLPTADRSRWYVVVGPGRSGSTILDRLLSARGVVAVGELVHLWQRAGVENQLCACGLAAHDCPFWSAVLHDALGPSWERECHRLEQLRQRHGTYRAWPRMVFRPRSWANDVGALATATAAVVEAIGDRVGPDPVVWDASKSAIQARLLALAGAAPQIVILTRHPAAVAYSWARPKARFEAGGRPMPRHGLVGSSLRWSFAVISGLAEAYRCRRAALHLDYCDLGAELLVGDRNNTTVEAGAQAPQPPATAWVHAIGGNPDRWEGTPPRFEVDE